MSKSVSIEDIVGPLGESDVPSDLGLSLDAATKVKRVSTKTESSSEDKSPENLINSMLEDDSPLRQESPEAVRTGPELKSKLQLSSEFEGGEVSDFGVAIPLAQIIESPLLQPRLKINEDHVSALAGRFERYGQLNEIVVRPSDSDENIYEIIGGNHRYRAAKQLGWDTIRCFIKRVPFGEAQILAIDDNDSNLPTSDYERALAYKRLLDAKVVPNQAVLARNLGVDRSRISQCLTILSLPKEVLRLLDIKPDLFGYRVAVEIRNLISELTPEGEPPSLELIKALTKSISKAIEGGPVADIIPSTRKQLRVPKVKDKIEPLTFSNSEGKVIFKSRIQSDSLIFEVSGQSDEVKKEMQGYLSSLLAEKLDGSLQS